MYWTSWTSLVAQTVKTSAYNAGDPGLIPRSGRSPGEGNGNPLSTLAWTEEPDRRQSMGSQRVRHDWVTSLSLSREWIDKSQNARKYFTHTYRGLVFRLNKELLYLNKKVRKPVFQNLGKRLEQIFHKIRYTQEWWISKDKVPSITSGQ